MDQAQEKTIAERNRQEIEHLVSRLDLLAKDGRVSRNTAVRFMEKSAWWLTHASGPVREPGYAARIEGNESSWRLKYGANTFQVSEAIVQCRKELQMFLRKKKGAPNFSANTLQELRQSLADSVRGSVSGYDGRQFTQYPIDGDKMIFGAHAINVTEFINCLFDIVPVNRLIAANLKLKERPTEVERRNFKFSKAMEKHYKRVISAATRTDQVENALLTLQSADNVLRSQTTPERQSVFSALSESMRNRQGNTKQLMSLLFSLFSQQEAIIRERKDAKPVPRIKTDISNILESAGFDVPKAADKNE